MYVSEIIGNQLFRTASFFGNPYAPILPEMHGLVAKAILETPEGKRLYLERFQALYPVVLNTERIRAKINDVFRLVRPALAEIDPDLPEQQKRRTEQLLLRINHRFESIRVQLHRLENIERKKQ